MSNSRVIARPKGTTASKALLCSMLMLAGWLLAPALAQAEPGDAPETVQMQVSQAMEAFLDAQGGGSDQLTLRAGRLDPRLRLGVCDQALEINESRPLNLNRGRQTVKVSCHGNSPWRIYVPVELTRRQQAVVAARPLAAGDVLGIEDLDLATVDANRARRQYYTDPAELVGMMATQPLQSGQLVTAHNLGINAVVERGDIVSIQVGHGGFVVGSTGEAQGRAGVGQRVKVKNTGSGNVIETVVIDSRTVEAIGR
ncbi:flagella basal body P-ring formation protein FlgA [Guyparkeria sp. SCN-R1]|uniref:flagellar basal body P-ring formation chaperone FlgA n=1 Tax=Guyparkeria sp. SCN-R1 TaxID=2341113 RepID=UPI000F647B6F|nr:flagellar basal body P-ring formation chaperone FlgA [Guyparkeria sp. SCN-R1]RRQ24160.1 flagella basal body P-ring formation protein FlgA [Guyparkeria sp. SCN-R1]